MLNIAAILIAPFIANVFIPFYNKLQIITAYEFLEKRFSYFVRAIGSASFILFQLGRVGIILLLPSLAISVVSGIPVSLSILVMGVLCVIFVVTRFLCYFPLASHFTFVEVFEYAKEKTIRLMLLISTLTSQLHLFGLF